MYLFFLGWATKSWEKVVVYAYLPLSVYHVGQLYVFRFIQPWELNSPLYPDGRSSFFKLTPLLLFSIAIIMSFLTKLFVNKVKSWWMINILLVILSLDIVRLIVNNSFLPWWVNLANFLLDFSLVVWAWWVCDYLSRIGKVDKEFFWKFLGKLTKTILIITSVLVLIQGIKGSSLGLIVEQSKAFPYFGVNTNELGLVPRPIGLMGDANNQGFRMLMILMTWILLYIRVGNIDWKRQKWLILPMLAIIWLQSRSVYLAIVPIIFWFWYYGGLDNLKKLKLTKTTWWLAVSVLVVVIMIIGVRFWGSMSSLGGNSGWLTRTKLLGVSERMISHHFWVGVGKDNFSAVAFREDLTGFVKTFPWPVHNGFILILAEQGIFALLLWFGFLFIFIFNLFRSHKYSRKIQFFVLAGLLAQFTVLFFQSFSEILSWLVIVGVILLSDDKTGI